MYRTSHLWLQLSALATFLSTASYAAPPPPPPAFLDAAAEMLIDSKHDTAAIENLFADDIAASFNGASIATGKSAWLQWNRDDQTRHFGKIIAYAESCDQPEKDQCSVMVIDMFDTMDLANPVKGIHMDPRLSSRSTIYMFGADHLIHAIHIQQVSGFLRPPRPKS